jgi:hypothetical protein
MIAPGVDLPASARGKPTFLDRLVPAQIRNGAPTGDPEAMNDRSEQASRQRDEAALLQKHGRYPGGKIPVEVRIEPHTSEIERVLVTYEDGTRREFTRLVASKAELTQPGPKSAPGAGDPALG